MYGLTKAFDRWGLTWIHSWPTWLAFPMNTATFLGNPVAVLVIFTSIAGYGLLQHRPRLVLGSAGVALTISADSLLKVLFHRSRPNTKYVHDMVLQTYSFPSGHASASMVGYGLLAFFAWKLLPAPWNSVVAVLLALFIILVGVSRVYLGAHYPSDVVAGWLVGAIGLLIIIFCIKPLL